MSTSRRKSGCWWLGLDARARRGTPSGSASRRRVRLLVSGISSSRRTTTNEAHGLGCCRPWRRPIRSPDRVERGGLVLVFVACDPGRARIPATSRGASSVFGSLGAPSSLLGASAAVRGAPKGKRGRGGPGSAKRDLAGETLVPVGGTGAVFPRPTDRREHSPASQRFGAGQSLGRRESAFLGFTRPGWLTRVRKAKPVELVKSARRVANEKRAPCHKGPLFCVLRRTTESEVTRHLRQRRGPQIPTWQNGHRLAPGCSETKGHPDPGAACVKADPEHRGPQGPGWGTVAGPPGEPLESRSRRSEQSPGRVLCDRRDGDGTGPL